MQNAQPTLLRDLIERVARADRRAFDTLYEATSARLNALCLSILKDRRAAEEALEQVYIRIWAEAPRFPDSTLSPMAWLTVLTRATALAHRAGPAPNAAPRKPEPAWQEGSDPTVLLRMVWLEGLSYADLARHTALPRAEVRHLVHEGLERLAGHAADDADSFAAAEQALDLGQGDALPLAQRAEWQERLARLADDLTPVMAPARARQRIRESLGHGAAPLSVDPLEQQPWWRGPLGIALALLLVGAVAWWGVWGR